MMGEPQLIRTEDGYLTDLGRELGEQRLKEFITGQGQLQAMALFLVMAVVSAPRAGYSEEALTLIIGDAEDVRQAANDWADSCVALAQAWRAQRLTEEARTASPRGAGRSGEEGAMGGCDGDG